MTTPANVYPFATQDGKTIPLDIIKPTGLIYKNFIATPSNITIPDIATVGILFSNEPCILKFLSALPVSLVENTVYTDTVFVPANTFLTVSLTPGTASVKAVADGGTLYLQLIEKWAGLGLPIQFQRK